MAWARHVTGAHRGGEKASANSSSWYPRYPRSLGWRVNTCGPAANFTSPALTEVEDGCKDQQVCSYHVTALSWGLCWHFGSEF